MIIDSHCHAWSYWPYVPGVPYPQSHGTIEQLLHRIQLNGVDQAAIVCAGIWHNRDNNDYVAAAVRANLGRIHQLADIDSYWGDSYHTPGAAKRLEESARRLPMKGFTQYQAKGDDASWFSSPEGRDFLGVARDLKLIASIACGPQHVAEIMRAAERFPDVPFLLHHMAGVRATEPPPRKNFQAVMEASRLPNVYLKLSGFAYLTATPWDFPYRDTHWVYEGAYEKFGSRMCWGSDYPPVENYMTHRQSLEAFRAHCSFVSEADRDAILGGTLATLLQNARAV
ncbi:MAG: amidohydrolase [Chloroflexi bacterium]|nr:amidohydrolase [Chloroflexota bacterium]